MTLALPWPWVDAHISVQENFDALALQFPVAAVGGGGAPSGPAGGDLAGTYPNPTVKASVGLTGVPTAPTAAPGTNTTQIATTAFVVASGGGAPSGPAGGDLAGTYPNPTIKASVGLTGTPTGPTAAPGTSSTQLATTAFVQAAVPSFWSQSKWSVD